MESIEGEIFEGVLTLREFAMTDDVPLHKISSAVFEFLRGRNDVVVFGAHAVNVYALEPRMTADVDVMALDAPGISEALRAHLTNRFHSVFRTRELPKHGSFRVYRLRKSGNQHVVDVRGVPTLPPHRSVGGVSVVEPATLLAMKAISFGARSGTEKGITDRADAHRLLNRFPKLRTVDGEVARLIAESDRADVGLRAWNQLVNERFSPNSEDEDW